MDWSKFFIPTLKEVPVGTEAISHQLSLRAGLVNMLTAGVYSYLPLGYRVLKNIEQIIREEMNAAGAHELFLPCLTPSEIWEQTGRDKTLADVMISFENNKSQKVCLGPTHEEIITDLVKKYVQSYKSLPVTLYQIQTKFRDEARPRFGIVRACEFIMKDAYSFDRSVEGLKKSYNAMFEAYKKVFKRLDLDVKIIEADSGAMGGDVSHEFMVEAPIGEDAILVCSKDSNCYAPFDESKVGQACDECDGVWEKRVTMELGHIFQLGTKYSDSLKACFVDDDGKTKPMIMGCYGIGVSRVIAALIETHHDDGGIIWPDEVAPFDVEIIPLAKSEDETEIWDLVRAYEKELESKGMQVLVDDRKVTPGNKFNDADLIGIPKRIVIGQKSLKEGKVEVKCRRTGQMELIEANKAVDFICNKDCVLSS